MGNFTKAYNVEITENQKKSLRTAVIESGQVAHWVKVKGYDVTMTVNAEGNGNGIAVEFTQDINGITFPLKTIFIGKNGGIHSNIDHSL